MLPASLWLHCAKLTSLSIHSFVIRTYTLPPPTHIDILEIFPTIVYKGAETRVGLKFVSSSLIGTSTHFFTFVTSLPSSVTNSAVALLFA